MFAKLVEDETDNQEITRHGDAEHWQWCPFLGNAQPDEKVEQSNLEKIIEEMGTGKTDAIFLVGVFVKCETGCCPVVEAKANHIANGIGNAFVNVRQKEQIDGVSDGNGRNANHTEPEQFPESFLTE